MSALPQPPLELREITSIIPVHELQYMAFTGQHERVHYLFSRIPRDDWPLYANKYILHQTIWGGIEKLRLLRQAHLESEVLTQLQFIQEVVDLFSEACIDTGEFPREFYEICIYWSHELMELSRFNAAEKCIDAALENGVAKFPALHTQLLSRQAHIAAHLGNLAEAHRILASIVARPYLITDRHQIPDLLFNLGQIALLTGEVTYYKRLQFLGLRYFYTNTTDRRRFVDQLLKTYRRLDRVLLSKDIRGGERLLFFCHWLFYHLPDFRRIRLGALNRFFRLLLLGMVYAVNYRRKDSPVRLGALNDAAAALSQPRRIAESCSAAQLRRGFLITRAMGGIGDLLMMTPGIHALKRRFPRKEIFLAIPRRYFDVFRGNPDVRLIDIETAELSTITSRRWFNFTDCPASRGEALKAPRVRKNRIELFAQALGIRWWRYWRMPRRPRYFLQPDEISFRDQFWAANGLAGETVIGVQLQADETYRNYPHMEKLVNLLARRFKVLIFDARPISGFDHPNVIKIDHYKLRQAFAIASGCQALIAPDSAFVHLAGALEIPCIGLFGPIDGKVRTRSYPTVTYLDARKRLGCVACWRNESIPCKLTSMRPSVCMGDISLDEILKTLDTKLQPQAAKEKQL